MFKFYVMYYKQHGVGLIGPFDDGDSAADYGTTAQMTCWNDDPRWSVMELGQDNVKDGNVYSIGIEPLNPNIKPEPGAYHKAWGSDGD